MRAPPLDVLTLELLQALSLLGRQAGPLALVPLDLSDPAPERFSGTADLSAIEMIAAHWDACSFACSRTIRTAWARTSGENLLALAMPPSSQGLEPPGNPGRFNRADAWPYRRGSRRLGRSQKTGKGRRSWAKVTWETPGPCRFTPKLASVRISFPVT